MRSGPDGALLVASLAFAGAAGLGSAVAIRDQIPGRPFGISVPLSVPAGLLAGWGAQGSAWAASSALSSSPSLGNPEHALH